MHHHLAPGGHHLAVLLGHLAHQVLGAQGMEGGGGWGCRQGEEKSQAGMLLTPAGLHRPVLATWGQRGWGGGGGRRGGCRQREGGKLSRGDEEEVMQAGRGERQSSKHAPLTTAQSSLLPFPAICPHCPPPLHLCPAHLCPQQRLVVCF
jgi:hypothetical protein